MSRNAPGAVARNRLDHILPQGYLEGFTKQGKVSVFDIERRRWFESGTRNIAASRGFYDYSSESTPDQTADEAFAAHEARFPVVKRELVANGFSGWQSQLEFLLEFAQMLRSRSRLFRQQALAAARQSVMWKVKEVIQDKGRTGLKIEPFVQSEPDRETLLRNMTITTMRREIAKGAGLFSAMNWCLRTAADEAIPVITADDPVIIQGGSLVVDTATFQDPVTLIFFPLCWQACLIGSPARFDTETDAFLAPDLRKLQALYCKSDCRFVYSAGRISVP